MPANAHHYTNVLAVIFLSLGLVLNIFSLSSSNLASPNRAFAADDCYDSEGNYICNDMSDGSNSDSSSGDSGGDSGSGDSGGDSGSGDSGGDSGSGDSGTTCNDEEGGYICAQPDESPPDNLGDGSPTKDEPSTNDTNGDNPSTKDDTSSDNKQIPEDGNGTDSIQPFLPAICNNDTGCDDTCPDGNNCDVDAPIADAGPDREISEGESLSIDGSQSNDPNGDDLQYHWEIDNSLISGSQDGTKLDITGPEVQEDTYYTVTLKVTDKDGNSDSDHMSLKVIDTSGRVPEPIPCDEYGNMTGSDCPQPIPEPIPCDEYGNMTGNGTGCVPNPVPQPPCEYGNMTRNGTGCIPNPVPQPCETTGGNATGGNATKCRPHANAGPDRTLQEGQIITIDGSRSYDSDGTINNYRWTYRIGNGTDNLILNGLHADKLRLRAPEVNKDQMYIIALTVTDKGGLSDKDSMKLLVKDTINTNSATKKTTTKTVTTAQKGEILKYYYIGKIGFPGTGKGQVLEPTDVAVDTLHNIIYVADKDNNRIDVFDTNGKYIKSWGSLGSGKGQFNNPADLAADFARGLIFVSDIGNNRVEKFDTNGKFLGMWGSSGTGIGQFDQTGDISLDPTEKMVYVSDIGNHRIQKFDYDGNFVKSWGTLGTGSGQFNRPAGLTYDSSGIVFVADTKNNRIQKFDKQGTFVQSWGIQGKGLGQLQNPVSITAEPDSDYVYVTHGGDKRIEVFDKHGKHVISWGSAGVGNGQLKRAVSVAFGNDNEIFVTDKDKSEIDIFGIVYQTQPNEVKQTNTKTTTTKSVIANGNDDTVQNKKKTGDTTKPKNDPCNYYGLNVCDKDRKGCDNQNFDCLTDSCNDGKPGTTGRCDGDDDKVCWKNGQYLNKCYPAHEGQS